MDSEKNSHYVDEENARNSMVNAMNAAVDALKENIELDQIKICDITNELGSTKFYPIK